MLHSNLINQAYPPPMMMIQAWRKAATNVLGGWRRNGNTVPTPAKLDVHPPFQGGRAGGYAVVALSRLHPPGNPARHHHHPPKVRLLPVQESASHGCSYHHKYVND